MYARDGLPMKMNSKEAELLVARVSLSWDAFYFFKYGSMEINEIY